MVVGTTGTFPMMSCRARGCSAAPPPPPLPPVPVPAPAAAPAAVAAAAACSSWALATGGAVNHANLSLSALCEKRRIGREGGTLVRGGEGGATNRACRRAQIGLESSQGSEDG